MPSPTLSGTATAPDSSGLYASPLRREVLFRRLVYIMLVRVVLFTLILGGTVAVNFAWGTPEELGGPYVSLLFVFIAFIYAANIIYAVLLRTVTHLGRFAAIQMVGDLIVSAFLVHFTGGAESAFVLFFLLTPIAAAVSLDRRGALATAVAGVAVFTLVVLLGYFHWLPVLPEQAQLPWDTTPGGLGRSLLINSTAMVALAVLAGYLAEQLRTAAVEVEVQRAHIDDLATLNIDIIRCLTSGLITVSQEGRILTINQAAGEILGLAPHQATGKQLAELSPELAKLISGTSGVLRTELPLPRSGRELLLGISLSPLTDHLNQSRGRIINFQDLTAVRQMEASLKRSEHFASLGRMAAGIAHEIRNPLASISGSLELLSTEDLEAEERTLMEIALREIERLNTLITSFLEYARPQAPQLEALDLGREIDALLLSISALQAGPERPPVKVMEAEEGMWVMADRDQLRAILWNLVRNAWEAGEEEQVSIHVQAWRDSARLEIHDQAGGIPAEQVEEVFEPFFTTKEQGTGLGLATVQRMVQDHGGTIKVSSEHGRGSTFTIDLPRIERPED